MNNKILYIAEIILIPNSEISTDTPDLEILQIASGKDSEPFVPGTATFGTEEKDGVFTNQISWMLPGIMMEATKKRVQQTGAVVVAFTNGDTIVLHKNDGILQNTPIRPQISSTTTRSQVQITFTTNYLLL